MANVKISELSALGTTPAGGDVLPITDVSGTPTTKKVTVTNLMGAAPVQSVAGRTGTVTIANTDVSGLGTAATLNVGTADTNVVQLADVSGTVKLPAVDGSQLTNVSGTDATKLAISSNLSDLNNAGTARTNLGLGDAATKTVGTADTNVIAVSSGTVDLGGNKLEDFDASINDQTGTAYTLVAGDNGKVVVLDNASAVTVTVPSGLGAGFNCSFVQKGLVKLALLHHLLRSTIANPTLRSMLSTGLRVY